MIDAGKGHIGLKVGFQKKMDCSSVFQFKPVSTIFTCHHFRLLLTCKSAPEIEAEWSSDCLNWSDHSVDEGEDDADESPENGEHCKENDADPEPKGHKTAFLGTLGQLCAD